jgi:hypothetical protein
MGEAVRQVPVPLGIGTTVGFLIQAGLWYACVPCHRYIKGNGWAALAKAMGFPPEGNVGSDTRQAFRMARKKRSWVRLAAYRHQDAERLPGQGAVVGHGYVDA